MKLRRLERCETFADPSRGVQDGPGAFGRPRQEEIAGPQRLKVSFDDIVDLTLFNFFADEFATP